MNFYMLPPFKIQATAHFSMSDPCNPSSSIGLNAILGQLDLG